MAQKMSHSGGGSDELTLDYAKALDREDPLGHLRAEFLIPTKSDLKRKTLAETSVHGNTSEDLSIYLCGNSLGLQPRRTQQRIASHLSAWATKAVLGHFFNHEGDLVTAFLHVEDQAAEKMAHVVGALRSEVALMETLTANLHLLMLSFYQPIGGKFKIVMEGKAFPSDRYAVESQVLHYGHHPKEAIILIEPTDPSTSTISTSQILATIDEYASDTALVLLPGVQYYTGQYFDIKTITAHAHSKGLLIGWDLAHAVGNVDIRLHEWDVDFAVWCNYKYVNGGPGSIAGLFVHEKHGKVDTEALEKGEPGYRPRLSGWWGAGKVSRFAMGNSFVPTPGAAGFQVGNPSALALTSLTASLEVFGQTNMEAIRTKSIKLTGFLEALLLQPFTYGTVNSYHIITPTDPEERGAQISVLLEPGMLEGVMAELEAAGVVVDERKPDVIRIAPAPLYNTYADVWGFVRIFKEACEKVNTERAMKTEGAVMLEGAQGENGWNEIVQ